MNNQEEEKCYPDIITYSVDYHCLQLCRNLLYVGDRIEVRIVGYWIPGHVSRDISGWYLLTNDGVGIRLQTGLTARICQKIASEVLPVAQLQTEASQNEHNP